MKIKNFLRRFKIFYLLKGYIKVNNKYYFLKNNKFYSSPSLRQALILKSYVRCDDFYEQREEAPSYFLKKLINHNSIIIDIGGNLGYSALYYSRILQSFGNGQCLSFEPVSENFSHMIFNFGRLTNVMFFNFGISYKTDDIEFGVPQYSEKYEEINTGLYTSKNVDKDYIVEKCKVCKLDDVIKLFCKESSTIDYIKLDIEGSEMDALKGAKQTLIEHSPIVQVEYNINTISKEEHSYLKEYLKDLHYKPYKIRNSIFDEVTGYEVFFIKNDILELLKKDKGFLNFFKDINNEN